MTYRASRFAIWILIIYSAVATIVSAQNTEGLDLDRIKRATVFVMQTQNVNNRPVITCIGSGTIVSRSGLIMTNAHNTVASSDCPGDDIIIALSVHPETAPIPTYRAEVAQANNGLDLALLRITQELNGRVVESGALALPFVEVADSSQVNLDDTITVVGYPNVGSDPVTSVRGTVSGFVAEPSAGERAWIKTEATIPGTMTGGGVYNQNGQLVGIPTTAPVTALTGNTTCISIEDTNSDGLVNRNDSCIAIGGFINALRPSNFARPLIRGASLGISVEKLSSPGVQLGSGGNPEFSRLLISSSVTDGMPTNVVRSLPTGASNLFLFFDYINMTPETIYELRVTIDNIPSPTFSLAPVRWSGGESGLWYIGTTGQVLPNGVYNFTLFVDGLATGSVEIIIGATQPAPTFSNIVFGIEDQQNLFGIGNVLPTGNIVNARFIHHNVADGTPWVARWFYNGAEIPGSRLEAEWVNDGQDTETIRIQDDNGLPPGRYRLELYLDNRLSATSDFSIAGAREGAFPRVFDNVRFTTADSVQAAIANTSLSAFSNTINRIYALFDWEQIAPGTLWRMQWSVDNDVFFNEIIPWSAADTGQNYIAELTGISGIPDGAYRMDLFINDVQLGSVEAEVGIGQLPIDEFAQTTGVQLNGQIIDAETGEGIPGVTFILLTEDYSVADYDYDANQVFADAVTDRHGRFQLDRLLEYGAPYSVIIEVEGFLPIRADGVEVDLDTENPLEVTIPLTRD
jgi:hypothetical protein